MITFIPKNKHTENVQYTCSIHKITIVLYNETQRKLEREAQVRQE
jgi:membrane-bound inhibitor of C-type lysozyme